MKQKSLHLQNKILRSGVKYTSTEVSKRSGGARSRQEHRMTSSLTVAGPLAGGPLLPLPLLHQARGARLAQEHLDTSTIQVTTSS